MSKIDITTLGPLADEIRGRPTTLKLKVKVGGKTISADSAVVYNKINKDKTVSFVLDIGGKEPALKVVKNSGDDLTSDQAHAQMVARRVARKPKAEGAEA